jgi:hypothetical protein
MGLSHSPRVVTDGLTLFLDPGNPISYPESGTTWYDLSGNGNHFTVQSGSWVSSGPSSYFNFGGSYCCAKRLVGGALTDIGPNSFATIMTFTSILNSTTTWRTLVRGTQNDHQILINTGTNNLGMYDSNNSGFITDTFDVSTLPNYTTQFNCLYWKLAQSSPYYSFGYNSTLSAGTDITNVNATFNNGFSSVGGHHNFSTAVTSSTDAVQYWGNVGPFLYYNRTLSSQEILQNFHALRGRFGI